MDEKIDKRKSKWEQNRATKEENKGEKTNKTEAKAQQKRRFFQTNFYRDKVGRKLIKKKRQKR